MTTSGRIVIDPSGDILSVDAAFCATIRTEARHIVGRSVLEFTAPADRHRCIGLLGQIKIDGRPLTTVKRLVRPDGSHCWVHNALARSAVIDGEQTFEIIVHEAVPPEDWIDPAAMLHLARLIQTSQRSRDATFNSLLFSDHAWDILLAAYIGEAEGKLITTADLHAAIGISLANASRWMRALGAEGLLEYEDGTSTALVTSTFRLSSIGHKRFEDYLCEIHRSADLDGLTRSPANQPS